MTTTPQAKNALHGITLEVMVTDLVSFFGWAQLGERIAIHCFKQDPSVASSLKFLRKTPWARTKVEGLYLFVQRERARRLRRSGAGALNVNVNVNVNEDDNAGRDVDGGVDHGHSAAADPRENISDNTEAAHPDGSPAPDLKPTT